MADSGLDREQVVVAAAFDWLGDVVGKEGVGFGTGAAAVLEDEAIFEASAFD